MSQEPSVLLVDLPEQGTHFARALSQVGRPSVVISPDLIAQAFDHGRPLCVVALSKDASEIAAKIRHQDYAVQLPFFVLQPSSPGSVRPPLPEVTAVVPEGVEPGILALRIQTALQQAGGPRPRQATVLGMGSMSKPQALPSRAPSKPPKSTPISQSPQAQAKAPELPQMPAEVPWDTSEERVVSSVPPKIESRAVASAPRQGVVSSAPPLPEIRTLTPSAPNIPDAAPLPADVMSPSNPPLPPTKPESVPTHPPVAMASPEVRTPVVLDDDETAMKKSSWAPRALIAAGLVAALGIGGVVLSSSKDEKKTAAADPIEPPEPKVASKAAAPDPQETAAPQESASHSPEPAPSGPEEPTGEARYYLVEHQTTLETCEKVLGKSASDFASAKKWQASQSWKSARQSLMAGSETKALEHMCEAAFIDAAGPATLGLARYYLGKRSLDQAHVWAKKALDSASGAGSKRAAQQVLGDVFSQMGQPEEARKVWLESFNLTEDQTDRLAPVVRNFINAGVKARKGGDPALAEQLLRRATTFEPENVNASALLAATLLDNGEKKLAKLWAERALEKKPGLEMAEEVLKAVGG